LQKVGGEFFLSRLEKKRSSFILEICCNQNTGIVYNWSEVTIHLD